MGNIESCRKMERDKKGKGEKEREREREKVKEERGTVGRRKERNMRTRPTLDEVRFLRPLPELCWISQI